MKWNKKLLGGARAKKQLTVTNCYGFYMSSNVLQLCQLEKTSGPRLGRMQPPMRAPGPKGPDSQGPMGPQWIRKAQGTTTPKCPHGPRVPKAQGSPRPKGPMAPQGQGSQRPKGPKGPSAPRPSESEIGASRHGRVPALAGRRRSTVTQA